MWRQSEWISDAVQAEELEAELLLCKDKREKDRAKADQRRQEGLQAVEEAAMMAEQAQTQRDEAQQAFHELAAEVKALTGRLLQQKDFKPSFPEVRMILGIACTVPASCWLAKCRSPSRCTYRLAGCQRLADLSWKSGGP